MDDASIARQSIIDECDVIKNLLLEKNKFYGNSAMQPLQVFSGLGAIALIDARIDDKLSRIRNLRVKDITMADGEDTIMDLIGYLVLRRIVVKK